MPIVALWGTRIRQRKKNSKGRKSVGSENLAEENQWGKVQQC